MIEIQIKTFSELTTEELYRILQLRSEVFVVEQDCIYQDIDGEDDNALHVLGIINQQIIAYARLFKSGDYFEYASIGRVVVTKNHRRFNYGYEIMKASIEAIETYFNETTILISAQAYLKAFYKNCGFVEFSGIYLEDNIPHIMMIKEQVQLSDELSF